MVVKGYRQVSIHVTEDVTCKLTNNINVEDCFSLLLKNKIEKITQLNLITLLWPNMKQMSKILKTGFICGWEPFVLKNIEDDCKHTQSAQLLMASVWLT